MLSVPVKLRLHFSAFHSAQETPPLMSFLLLVIFVCRAMCAMIQSRDFSMTDDLVR